MRNASRVGTLVWSAFFAVDLLVVHNLHVATIPFFAIVRLAVCGEMAVVLWCLRHRVVSFRARTVLDLTMHTVCSAAIAVMCLPFWGIESPYAAGICLVLVHRMIFGGDSWGRGAVMYAIPAATYPATMFAGAAFDSSIARQLHNTRSLSLFAIYLAFVFGTAALATVGGHIVWSLRRQVFEARSLGRYKLRHRIGSGATGEVWLAHHAALKRDVAIKVLRHDAYNDVGISRFEREAHATAALVHPNTVRIFDFGTTEDGLWYYAMELLEGETLAQLVHREGPLSPARTVHIALQAARALSEAHGHGIVHRDVKPSNLFITTIGGEPDFVKVLDFGVARFFRHGPGDSTLTTSGDIVGTPAYISPEAVLAQEVDARADVYALGAVLYFMLTGAPPFEAHGDGAVSLLLAQVHRVPQPPSARSAGSIPVDLEAVVMKCLEKTPYARYKDGAELVCALAACRLFRTTPAKQAGSTAAES